MEPPPGNWGRVERGGVKDLRSTGEESRGVSGDPLGVHRKGDRVREDQVRKVLGGVSETWNRILVLCQRGSWYSRF